MPFRSVKSWFAISASALWGAQAFAVTTSVIPISYDGTLLGNVANGTQFYYPSSDHVLGAGQFHDSADASVPALLDLSANQGELSPRPGMLRFLVSTDKALTIPPGGQAVLVVTTGGSAQGPRLVPIATVGSAETFCNDSLCQSRASMTVNGRVDTFYYGVRYTPGQQLRIGIYPADLCGAYSATPPTLANGSQASTIGTSGGFATGCTKTNAAATVPLRDSTSEPMQLSFWFTTMEGTDVAALPAIPSGNADLVASAYFEKTPPTLSCPSNTDLYFPGDQNILLDGSKFAIGTAISPGRNLIVVGNDGAAAVPGTTYASANTIVRYVGFGSSEIVSGFTNTTTGTDHYHQLEFMVRNLAGHVVGANCTINNVQTAPIQGFITKNGCFIATAAHGSGSAAPVMLLRKFRDQVLLKTEPGRAFVRWYYSWSPDAAKWLESHPAFRLPVLILLVPFEILAWIALHPEIYLGLFAVAVWSVGISLVFLLRRLLRSTFARREV